MKKICPSILSADFSKLSSEIIEIESAGADIIHCDIMDGHFVPNITFGPDIIAKVNEITELPLDVHLMIENADKYIEAFRASGADLISVHYENNKHLNKLVEKIKSLGARAGVVINPATNIFVLEDIIEYTDFVLVMSVNPGFGGQKFIPNSVDKIKKLKELAERKNKNCLIEIDGGISLDNIKTVSDAGADMFVCGASVFKAKDRKSVIKEMKKIVNPGV
jgi:ribulose-phosphate 3-epimerase